MRGWIGARGFCLELTPASGMSSRLRRIEILNRYLFHIFIFLGFILAAVVIESGLVVGVVDTATVVVVSVTVVVDVVVDADAVVVDPEVSGCG